MQPAHMPDFVDAMPDALVVDRMADRLVREATRPLWPTDLTDPVDVGLALAQAGFRMNQIERLGILAAAHARACL